MLGQGFESSSLTNLEPELGGHVSSLSHSEVNSGNKCKKVIVYTSKVKKGFGRWVTLATESISQVSTVEAEERIIST